MSTHYIAQVNIARTMWCVPQGYLPDIEEAKRRLTHLAAHGPSAFTFTFKGAFPAPDLAIDAK